MTPLEVNRADLAWAIQAVLPHVGSAARSLDYVGFYGWSELKAYATDGYTVGVARVALDDDLQQTIFALPVREAKDLLRFIKPTLVRHQAEKVQLLVADDELHVALEGALNAPGIESEPLSEVFSVVVPEKGFYAVYGLVDRVKKAEPETAAELPFKPDFAARFSKAARLETDRLILSPRQSPGLGYGASYVTVGDNFEGAIAGLTYEPVQQTGEAA